ncbi:DUF3000 domain-containing protein [Leucobacter viscericola]|uniref:DUF3000 domain-containing protein n=1 Tax=Leucobacter viscericola TaxID=2714935 RepID=A0A6G7XJD9_9MICO|nr:DUF3000 domain-containing protein [Leucobacter viscericola]QIK64632.1 DUF3000 domain-containing protein [Leucobacter viscericola]
MATIAGQPLEFTAAADQIRGATLRRELKMREIPAPERIAPYSIALAAGVARGAEDDTADDVIDSAYGAGRIILMYDPESSEEWGGPFRIVCFAQAPLEVEIGVDPFISDVAWSWLVDALDSRGANYTYLSGTATKTLSSGFGSLEAQGDAAQIELRASWTPTGDNFAVHAEAWSELLCLLAGLPHQEGVESLTARRTRQGLTGA